MRITRVTGITEEIVSAFVKLVPQLTDNYPSPTEAELSMLLSSDSSVLLVAREPGEHGPIIGAATLVVYRVPTGVHAHLEDVVVDEAHRGQGVGEALVREALYLAEESGADGGVLTSNSRREGANRLYQKLGFKRWETNLYFYKF
jgi:ribosomal protein S18 acetylase RimI-like enzyme